MEGTSCSTFMKYSVVEKPSENAMYYITMVGWALLLGLMMLGLYNDINRLWG